MSKLVDELKKEHEVIVNVLSKVNRLGISTKEGQSELINAKKGLLEHLKKEDDLLYPVLHKEAENDESLQRTLKFFATEMEKITVFVLDFFSKYEKGGSGLEFSKDYGRLFSSLQSRINKEESMLYKAYNKIKGE